MSYLLSVWINIAIRFGIMCLHPIEMWSTGRLTKNGKSEYTFKTPRFGVRDGIPVPCGKCSACLDSRRREWSKRLVLESSLHSKCSFFTLTYNNKSIPFDGLASKNDIQKFLKRFRQVPRDYDGCLLPDFKYFIVCEYGSKTYRPHYHGVFFGVDFFEDCWKPSIVSVDKYPRISSSVLSEVWGKGFVLVDRLTPRGISYVSKYVVKQFDKVRPTWSLKSIGLAKDIFVDSSGLTSQAFSSLHHGKVAVSTPSGFYFVRPPKFIDRYVERFEPSLYDSIRESRRSFASSMPLSDVTMLRSVLETNHQRQKQKGTLDNETPICP